ncbi:MAG: 2-C-methyl-D-erythritol 2,4-cyclodiphosphate synthase [Bacteroidota bacterium]
MFRIGFGFDTHKLEPNRDFYLGGIKIPSLKGAVGHSDADVLLHAICDALLGASALGDIGNQFPDTDPQYKGIDSKILLAKVFDFITQNHYQIVNLDTTICLEKPKVSPFVPEIQQSIASLLHITPSQVSIKAKTSEKLGFIGREEGVAAYCVVLLEKM